MTFNATTWNPADKSTSCTLSGGDLIATGNMHGGVRSMFSASSGKWYWEYTILPGSISPIVGICNAQAALKYPGIDENGWGYYGITGGSYNSGAEYEYGSAYSEGETIGVALDMDAGTVAFTKNGSNQGIAFTGLTGPIYALVAGGSSEWTSSILANFGATAFSETPPAGYTAGFGYSPPVNTATLVERITAVLQDIGADVKALQDSVVSVGHGTATYTAASALSGHVAVTLNSAGQATPADCRTTAHAGALCGATVGAASAGAPVTVRGAGLLESPGWGLTPDQPVYLGEAGALVQSVPPSAAYLKQIGVALSASSVLIDLQPAIFLT